MQAWPEVADVLALVRAGLSYDEARRTSPLECDRILAIASAWAIPADRREGGTVFATPSDIDMLYG